MTVFWSTVTADVWGWHHSDMGIGWAIMMLLFWGAVVVLIVSLVRGNAASREETPHEILRRRLADGSITIEEFERRQAALDHAGEVTTSTSRAT